MEAGLLAMIDSKLNLWFRSSAELNWTLGSVVPNRNGGAAGWMLGVSKTSQIA